MRISKDSNAGRVAGSVAGLLRAGCTATLEAIGAGATYQSVNAILIASEFVKSDGINTVITLRSTRRNVAGTERNVILLDVKGERNVNE